MAGNTKIEWTDYTFNSWVGCQKVSPGCDLCYAEAIAQRFQMAEWGANMPRKKQSEAYWRKPLAWNKKAEREGVRRRVFCASMADVFDNMAPLSERQRLWITIRDTPNLDWQLLTKRPENILRMLPADWGDGYPNVWLGISAEDQERYDHRWPILANVPAVIRFVSYEPALGPLGVMNGSGKYPDWLICGGESGPGARPMQPDWARWICDECDILEIPFFFKQFGKYRNNPLPNAEFFDPPANGKGGALLDGRLWREFPQVTATV